jgi:opacity protein-like surface antigen
MIRGVWAGLILVLLASSAYAHNGFYLGGHGALVLLDEARNDSSAGRFNLSFDSGYQWGAVLGVDLRDAYPSIGIGRIEIEVSQRSNDADEISFLDSAAAASGRVRVESLMFNTFGEHRQSLPWIPYVGAGVGVARVRMDNVSTLGGTVIDDEDTVFAWQVGAGIGLQAFRHLAFDLGYRYFQAVDPKFTDTLGVASRSRYRAHSVLLGARLMF